jgi:putative heme-binding domain-containing protein
VESQAILVEALRSAPDRLQVKLAQILAGSAGGGENLLTLIEEGRATPRLLLAASVKDKLLAAQSATATQRIEKLTRNLTPTSEQIEKLLQQRRAGYAPAKASTLEGARVFAQNCSVCHRIDGNGGLVGPQLDGIGNRGLERLVEDVLDSNRNVDRAFRTHLLTLKNGDVISGLPRREEGEVLVLADSTGKEISLAKKDVQERRESETSLMPENFGEILAPEDFNHLMAYLLSKASSAPKQR